MPSGCAPIPTSSISITTFSAKQHRSCRLSGCRFSFRQSTNRMTDYGFSSRCWAVAAPVIARGRFIGGLLRPKQCEPPRFVSLTVPGTSLT